MKRILILDPADFLGGAELFMTEILEELKSPMSPLKKGISNEFSFTVLTTGKCEEYVKRIPFFVRVEKTDLPRLRPFRPILFLKTIFRLRRFLREQDVDLIHSNSVRAGIFAAFLGKPWTHFAHDFTTPKLFLRFFKRAQKIFTCSQAVANSLEEKGILKEKLKVVHNGIDREKFSALPRKVFDAEHPVIAIVGRLARWKGQMMFLKAAEILQQKIPGAKFLIFGESSSHDEETQKFERELREYVRSSLTQELTPGLTKCVEFKGFQPVSDIFPKIDLLIHASTEAEPFGRTVLEALAANIPVIASNIGGPKEILSGEVLEKFLIEPNNPKLLAEKIEEVLGDERLREEYEKAAQERVKDFEMGKVVGKVKGVWSSILLVL